MLAFLSLFYNALAFQSPLLSGATLTGPWGLTQNFQIKDSYSQYCLVIAGDNKSLVLNRCLDKKPWHIYGNTTEDRSIHYGTTGFLVIDNDYSKALRACGTDRTKNCSTLGKEKVLQIGDKISGVDMDHATFELQYAPGTNPEQGRYILKFNTADMLCLLIGADGVATYGWGRCFDFTIAY